MKISTFIYIGLNLILFNLIKLESEALNHVIYAVCILGILSLGIAHGAIDNILYGARPGRNNTLFILKYLTIIALFAVAYLLVPNITFLLFFVVSAYHFGQSQFVDFNIPSKWLAKSLYLSWGLVVLLMGVALNKAELAPFNNEYFAEMASFSILIDHAYTFLVVSSAIFLITLVFAFSKSFLTTHELVRELYILALMALSFSVLPTLVAFSLYFVLLHSLKVISQEYEYCKRAFHMNSIMKFIKLFLPLTLASLAGMVVIIGALVFFNYSELIPFALLIMLSCITIPHSLVMEKFYGVKHAHST
ncbi:MAG TPA: hypothetical protein DDY13_09345 [Cytophagales bacterium]|jgi:Brp/Blh family beta-carotene 15,15'-monooxygenase|nr:hypothetical protein [Cytophagales bacterium]